MRGAFVLPESVVMMFVDQNKSGPTTCLMSSVIPWQSGGMIRIDQSRSRLITCLTAPLSYVSDNTRIKIHSSSEIEDFVETHLCKLCVILRSRVLLGVCPR